MKYFALKFLFLFCILFAFYGSIQATSVTIQSVSVPNWRAGGTTCQMRIYASGDFTDSLGVRYLGGGVGSANFFQTISGTVSGTVCTLNSFQLPSTTDAQVNPAVRYTAVLYDEKNIQRGVYLTSFAVPISLGTNVTFAQIAVYNQTPQRNVTQMAGFYTAPQVDSLIQQYVSVILPDSTLLTKGGVKLSVPPVSPTNPVALAANDPLVLAQVQTKYVDSYVNLNSAISAIGSSVNTKLVVSDLESVSANISIPRNIVLDFEAGGRLCPSSGITITVNAMRDPGSKQIFECAGKVIVGQNAVQKLDLTWWAGRDDSIDATKPVKDMVDSLWAGAAEARIPMGVWKTSETIEFPPNTLIEGMSNKFSGFKLTANNIPLMRISSITNSVVSDIHIKNLLLDASGVTGGTGLMLRGTAPWSASGITIADVRFKGGAVGIDFNSTDNAWELQHLTVDRAIFEAPTIGFRSNSLNSDIHFEQPLFYLPPGGTAIYVGAVGNLTVKNYNCFGSSVVVPGVPLADNSTFLYLFGARNIVHIEGGQDENIEFFIQTSTNPYPIGVLNLKSNLIQSKIKAFANTTLISENNLYTFTQFGVFQNAAGVSFVIFSKNDALDSRNLADGTPNPTYTVENFTGNTSRLARVENLTDSITKFGQFTEFRPGASLGGITQTVSPAFGNNLRPSAVIYGEGIGTPFLELSDKSGGSTFGYQFFRDTAGTFSLGWLVADGNQSGFSGFYFNKPVKIQGEVPATLTATQTLTNKTLSGANNTFSNIPQTAITNLTADFAPKASPAFTGTPSAPTATAGTNTTQLATTAFVQSQFAANVLTNSASLNFPSIAAVSQADLTITVTGAVTGDSCTASPNGGPEAGLVWNCFISAANTATVRLSNITAGAIDPAARSYKVTLIK